MGSQCCSGSPSRSCISRIGAPQHLERTGASAGQLKAPLAPPHSGPPPPCCFLSVLLSDLHALLNEEGRDPVRSSIGRCLGVHHQCVGHCSVGAPSTTGEGALGIQFRCSPRRPRILYAGSSCYVQAGCHCCQSESRFPGAHRGCPCRPVSVQAHHIFVPLSTKVSPRCSALQRMDTTSEPAPGSLIASAPTCSPAGACSFASGQQSCSVLSAMHSDVADGQANLRQHFMRRCDQYEANCKSGGDCQADYASGLRGTQHLCSRQEPTAAAHSRAPACQELRKVLAFLSLCAVPHNLVDAQVAVGAVAQAY